MFTFFVIFLTLSGSGFAKADVDVASASEKENTNQAESYAVEESVESRTYVTQFGDTLGGVAKKLFNRPDYWKVLLYYNQEILPPLKATDYLPDGTTLRYKVKVKKRVRKHAPVLTAPSPQAALKKDQSVETVKSDISRSANKAKGNHDKTIVSKNGTRKDRPRQVNQASGDGDSSERHLSSTQDRDGILTEELFHPVSDRTHFFNYGVLIFALMLMFAVIVNLLINRKTKNHPSNSK